MHRITLRSLARIVAASFALALCAHAAPASAAPPVLNTLTPITIVGGNPGGLNMYEYVTTPAAAPVVVVLHGCNQTVAAFDNESGWTALATAHGFNLIFAEQTTINNSSRCFNWFNPADQARGAGEPLSIRNMVSTFVGSRAADTSRVFVTGLSAGGAMAAVMLATYPDVFRAGAVNSGMPYKCATNAWQGVLCMSSAVYKTPTQWGNLARSGYPGYTGAKPDLIVFHGTADATVVAGNMNSLAQQWNNYRGFSQLPTQINTLKGYPRTAYGSGRVVTVSVTGMGHGLALEPGTAAADQCGTAGAYMLNARLCSSYYTGKFWGIF